MTHIKYKEGAREAYEIPSTTFIEVKLNKIIMNSIFTAKGSGSEELDELGETSHDSIIWN